MVTVTQPISSSSSSPVQVALENKDVEITISDPSSTPPTEDPSTPTHPAPSDPLPSPLRSPTWEAAELSYLNLAIKDLNSRTRTNNLMFPDLAKKPNFNLERELKMMYADIAPLLSETIRERARRPEKPLVEIVPHAVGSVLENFAMRDGAKIYDERRPQYGFRDFWRDLFKRE